MNINNINISYIILQQQGLALVTASRRAGAPWPRSPCRPIHLKCVLVMIVRATCSCSRFYDKCYTIQKSLLSPPLPHEQHVDLLALPTVKIARSCFGLLTDAGVKKEWTSRPQEGTTGYRPVAVVTSSLLLQMWQDVHDVLGPGDQLQYF